MEMRIRRRFGSDFLAVEVKSTCEEGLKARLMTGWMEVRRKQRQQRQQDIHTDGATTRARTTAIFLCINFRINFQGNNKFFPPKQRERRTRVLVCVYRLNGQTGGRTGQALRYTHNLPPVALFPSLFPLHSLTQTHSNHCVALFAHKVRVLRAFQNPHT